ncbi:MAG: hypothetical protein LHW64_09170 [Candidatus Cloacimonetes bacterium]|nr:hypothetical protein [Candidatus Cloacimonadota bacterium]MDY0230281.1 hypothetical protein [Candidatus Cloacimonadaceae bacterium]
MVHGIEIFKDYFEGYTGQYVFIGGTACEILLDEMGSSFRATKDLDMVLIIEALDESFGETFWKFIKDGGYHYLQKSSGKEQFYRFTKPEKPGFPAMIELFSRKPKRVNLPFDSVLTPIHVSDEVASLSAVLLNDAYYDLLLTGKKVVNGYSVLDIEYILLFKIRAWLDLSKRKQSGEAVDTKDVNKHKNDIFRLLVNVSLANRVHLNPEIRADLDEFLLLIKSEKVDIKNLGIKSINFETLMERMKNLYAD